MPTPTHAHSVGGVESGCHRVLHAAQLHTGTELSASQARSRAVRQTPGGSPCCLSRACRGAFDAVRARDAATAADRPRRRPWWSMAAIRARPLAPRLRRRRCGHGPTLGHSAPRLAARRAVSAERAAAHSTQRAPEMRLEPRIGDRPRRRPWWSVARIAAFARCTATNYHSQT